MLKNLLQIDELERKFVVALLITLVASYKIKNKKNLRNIFVAIPILYVAFELKQTIYILSSVAFNLFLLKFTSLNEYVLTIINIIILYTYKMYGIRFEPRITGSFDISGVLMLMTIKMSYLGKEFDRGKDKIRDALLYLMFIPGLVVGPAPTFEEFKKHEYEKPKKTPLWTFIKSLIFLCAFQILRKGFPRTCLFSENKPFLKNLLDLYLFNVGNRMKFYFAWHFSNGCFIMQNFPNHLNVNYLKVEFASSFKELATYWNICTASWLKSCFFVPFRNKSLFWASVMTSSISALWHGINPCYLIMFIHFSLVRNVEIANNKLIKKICPFLYPILSRIQMLFFVNYYTTAFFLLNISDLLRIWSSIYYIGHIIFFASIAIHLVLKGVFRMKY